MKHNWKETALIFGWLIVAVVLGFLFYPIVQAVKPETAPLSVPIVIGIAIGAIAGGFFFWRFAMKKFNPEWVDGIFVFAMAVLLTRVLTDTIEYYGHIDNALFAVTLRLAIYVVAFTAFWKTVKLMQKSWTATQKLVHFSNAWVMIGTAFLAAVIAVDISPLSAVLILLLASVYDAWAVWKSKTMIEFATYFMDRRVFPGIAVPKKKKGKFAVLGGGDVFFIALVAVAFLKIDWLISISAAFGMILALAVLFAFSQKEKFYPALPFIFGGLAVGIGFAGMIRAIGVLL